MNTKSVPAPSTNTPVQATQVGKPSRPRHQPPRDGHGSGYHMLYRGGSIIAAPVGARTLIGNG